MSDAWRGPVTLWREPRRGGVFRVAGRLLIAAAWVALSLIVQFLAVKLLLWLFALIAVAHAAIAVANLVRSKREVLRLAASGVIEWRPSLQEEWLRRPVDFLDGSSIVVTQDEKFPIWAPADPRVTLRGETQTFRSFPLYGASIDTFVETLNKELKPRRIVVVRDGSKEAAALRKRLRSSRSGTEQQTPEAAEGEQSAD